MSDVDAEHVYYDILKADYDEITQWARNAGYTDDEIRMLHQNAAQMRAKLGYNHSASFHIIMLAQRTKSTRHFDTIKLGRKRTMWTNLHRRLSIWWGEQLYRWEKRRHGRSYPWKGQDD